MTDKQQKFIEDIAKYVCKYAPQYDIRCNSAVIAQAILESGWGESRLASQFHNYFGLKCGTKWTGKAVNMKTQEEYTVGTYTTINDDFRAYDSMEEGVIGYFEFIQYSRYHNLRGITDPLKYLETIKADGYATSSTYVNSTYLVVTKYNLTKYDEVKEVTTVGNQRQKVVDIARAWLGCKESDGSHRQIIDYYNIHGKLARGYRMTYNDAWCQCFVSAVFKKAGLESICPVEVSCYYAVENAKKMGIWVENDNYLPKMGDIIEYDWDDSGAGDNTGSPDHTGIVESVSGNTITIIEGNYSNSVKRRTLTRNGRYIRGYITPKFTDDKPITPTPTKVDIDALAKDVIQGKYGNGDARKKALGEHYDAVQKRVNEMFGVKTTYQPKYYIVKKGDTMWGIAKKHNMKLSELIKLNQDIVDPNIIYVGQTVRVG